MREDTPIIPKKHFGNRVSVPVFPLTCMVSVPVFPWHVGYQSQVLLDLSGISPSFSLTWSLSVPVFPWSVGCQCQFFLDLSASRFAAFLSIISIITSYPFLLGPHLGDDASFCLTCRHQTCLPFFPPGSSRISYSFLLVCLQLDSNQPPSPWVTNILTTPPATKVSVNCSFCGISLIKTKPYRTIYFLKKRAHYCM